MVGEWVEVDREMRLKMGRTKALLVVEVEWRPFVQISPAGGMTKGWIGGGGG